MISFVTLACFPKKFWINGDLLMEIVLIILTIDLLPAILFVNFELVQNSFCCSCFSYQKLFIKGNCIKWVVSPYELIIYNIIIQHFIHCILLKKFYLVLLSFHWNLKLVTLLLYWKYYSIPFITFMVFFKCGAIIIFLILLVVYKNTFQHLVM